jgi:hypothetical protein
MHRLQDANADSVQALFVAPPVDAGPVEAHRGNDLRSCCSREVVQAKLDEIVEFSAAVPGAPPIARFLTWISH